MEIAGQWRREWAGTAEYGKVTEGGVTRRVARAMEVLHASGPGARVRVMRAAYHSSSGPGVPAASYMLHTSRRVISSGCNILESPTQPNKPLEISSAPLESSPELETESYKVTEPDDTEISEPSKWRGATNGSAIRMPSEESSSTDNASIIDLDSRFHKGIHRKYSYDSESSDIHMLKRNSARASPLLDAPAALSTLKFKSLLNGSNDWNNRRKSYSFEDTSPLNETILQSNDTLAMESSTDSGICKSSEIVNDYNEDTPRILEHRGKRLNATEESFRDWQLKNRSSQFHLGSKFNSYKERDIVLEDPNESKISLQSSGKVTITVPITIEADSNYKKSATNDDTDRKVKKVEFCKTELHFAAESGKVNIIATDEKPPPSNDFRKRKSAFVPIKDTFEKPITLFGERTDFSETKQIDTFRVREFSDTLEVDENTAATKSILKNKIPKPKPYLLGENMAFGDLRPQEQSVNDSPILNGVSLINKQLQPNRDFYSEHLSTTVNSTEKSFRDSLRTTNTGSLRKRNSFVIKHTSDDVMATSSEETPKSGSVRNKLKEQISPIPKAKTRQLRESELTYFGIPSTDGYQKIKERSTNNNITAESVLSTAKNSDTDFESVRLIKQVSNSACNSEAESEDMADYQNIPLKRNFAPVPTPRSRVKYKNSEEVVLKSIVEQTDDTTKTTSESRRSRSKKQEIDVIPSNRSLSEPAKKRNNGLICRNDELRRSYPKKEHSHKRYQGNSETEERSHNSTVTSIKGRKYTKEASPLYVNITLQDETENQSPQNVAQKRERLIEVPKRADINNEKHNKSTLEKVWDKKVSKHSDTDSSQRKYSTTKSTRVRRTEKLSTPEYPTNRKSKEYQTTVEDKISSAKKEHRSKSSQFHNKEQKAIHLDKHEEEKRKAKHLISKEDDTQLRNTHNSRTHVTQDPELHKIKEQKYTNRTVNLTNSNEYNAKIKDGADKTSHTNMRRPSRRSEYVIKYDDKNGTVSSVCKVKSGHYGPSKQKHISKERYKEHSKDSISKNKVLDKTALRNAAP